VIRGGGKRKLTKKKWKKGKREPDSSRKSCASAGRKKGNLQKAGKPRKGKKSPKRHGNRKPLVHPSKGSSSPGYKRARYKGGEDRKVRETQGR